MIPAFVVGVLIGGIVGWAISSWRNARDDVSPLEQSFHCTGVGLQRAEPERVDALWQQQIFRQMASGRFFEIR
jgi:hypothetical protein